MARIGRIYADDLYLSPPGINPLVQRLDRGLYLLVPLEAGPERLWSESPLVIAPYMLQPSAVAYWLALNYWEMTKLLFQSDGYAPPNEAVIGWQADR